MNICILTTGFPTPLEPGKYAFVDQLACTWADMGHKVTVIYPIPAFVEISDKKRFYKSEWERRTAGGNIISVLCPRYFSLSDRKVFGIETKVIAYRSFQKAVYTTISKMVDKPDVLYGHFLPSGCQAADVGEKLSIPSFCAFGESSLWSIEGRNIDNVRKSLSKLSGIVSVSTENKRVLIDNQLYRGEDIEVFPNGADHSLFCPEDKRESRKKCGFREEAFIGVYTGAFNDDKGVLRVQEAAVKAGNVEMIYIGGGKEKPVGSNILFCGKLQHESIPDYLNAADFFILPTKAEGCCNAIVEAMACGLPIISADGAYNDDILSEKYSIRTNPDDINAMTEAIVFLRDHSDRRLEMSVEARKASLKFNIVDRAALIIDFMQRKTKKHNICNGI